MSASKHARHAMPCHAMPCYAIPCLAWSAAAPKGKKGSPKGKKRKPQGSPSVLLPFFSCRIRTHSRLEQDARLVRPELRFPCCAVAGGWLLPRPRHHHVSLGSVLRLSLAYLAGLARKARRSRWSSVAFLPLRPFFGIFLLLSSFVALPSPISPRPQRQQRRGEMAGSLSNSASHRHRLLYAAIVALVAVVVFKTDLSGQYAHIFIHEIRHTYSVSNIQYPIS
ncbi:hypothetical protein B0T24DRAFT_280900 [Lasiosphaeria ovina]|uniref:Uncharacterized protein n=1 Tax=Lasiosphaeria ovina TaxID=92902 RepID=A0AAE0N8B4_9PEZI|nr:hypothetical protein B0T24DRAFT_280900 [Lasiosphaeria ovina]